MNRKKIKENTGFVIGRWFIRIFLFAWSVTIVFPLVWTAYTSLKSNKEFFANVWALPKNWRFDNYEYAWEAAQFSKYFANSLFVVIGTVLLSLLITSTTAYAIAKFRFRWFKILNKFYLIIMAVPGVLILVPQYFMFLNLGLTNKLWVLILLYAVGNAPGSIVMQIGFMRSVDNALLEAADIDGASEFQKFFNIIVPCVKPALFLTALTSMMSAWNEFIHALTFLTDKSKYTVAIGLSHLKNASTYSVEYGGLFAGLVIAMVPIIVVYTIFQKPLQEGVRTEGGVKG